METQHLLPVQVKINNGNHNFRKVLPHKIFYNLSMCSSINFGNHSTAMQLQNQQFFKNMPYLYKRENLVRRLSLPTSSKAMFLKVRATDESGLQKNKELAVEYKSVHCFLHWENLAMIKKVSSFTFWHKLLMLSRISSKICRPVLWVALI